MDDNLPGYDLSPSWVRFLGVDLRGGDVRGIRKTSKNSLCKCPEDSILKFPDRQAYLLVWKLLLWHMWGSLSRRQEGPRYFALQLHTSVPCFCCRIPLFRTFAFSCSYPPPSHTFLALWPLLSSLSTSFDFEIGNYLSLSILFCFSPEEMRYFGLTDVSIVRTWL